MTLSGFGFRDVLEKNSPNNQQKHVPTKPDPCQHPNFKPSVSRKAAKHDVPTGKSETNPIKTSSSSQQLLLPLHHRDLRHPTHPQREKQRLHLQKIPLTPPAKQKQRNKQRNNMKQLFKNIQKHPNANPPSLYCLLSYQSSRPSPTPRKIR